MYKNPVPENKGLTGCFYSATRARFILFGHTISQGNGGKPGGFTAEK